MTAVFMTPLQEQRKRRNIALYNEYNEIMRQPNQSKTEVNRYLMQKYKLGTVASVYQIRKQVEQQLAIKGWVTHLKQNNYDKYTSNNS